MKNAHLLKELLPNAHLSGSHGEFFTLQLPVGKMYIWAFESPYNLQMVITDEEGRITHDFRNDDCKADSDRWVRDFPVPGRTWVVTHRRSMV